MKDGLRFVACDMPIMNPPDLFEKYLEPKFRSRVSLPIGADGRSQRGTIVIDGLPTTMDAELQQYRKRRAPRGTNSTQPLPGSRLADPRRLDFAVAREFAAVGPIHSLGVRGGDIPLFLPTTGLSLLARQNMYPHLSLP